MKFGDETTLAQEIRRLKMHLPDVYRTYFSRIYRDDARFGDWRLPLWYAAAGIKLIMEHPKEFENTPALAAELIVSHDLGMHGNPMFFVEPDIFRACQQTTVPGDLNIAELQLPFESFSFIFPKGVITRYGEDVQFVTLGRIPKGLVSLAKDRNKVFELLNEETTMVFSAFFPKKLSQLSILITGDLLGEILSDKDTPVGYADQKTMDTLRVGREITQGRTAVGEDRQFALEVVPLCINLILAMEARPDVVERERKVKSLRHDRTTELWQPNVIGKRYRIERKAEDPEHGTHLSPRTHWRRGHWRRQGIGPRLHTCATPDCGHELKAHCDINESFCLTVNCPCSKYTKPEKRFSEYKTRWIEPILVCA